MRSYINISIIVFVSFLFGQPPTVNYSGYLKEIEVSFCMDECSHFYLESETHEFITNISFGQIAPDLFLNRFVQIIGEDIWCVECGAVEVEQIELSTECEYPVSCVVDPCDVAPDCQLNTPVECISNYCGGCYADFYDLNGNLVDCYNSSIDECADLSGIDFGVCTMVLGVAVNNNQCDYVSGCSTIVNGIDYSNAFFESIQECENACFDIPYTCEDIEYDYNQLHSGIFTQCDFDNDCMAVWGHCDVGLGGCHYAVNTEDYPFYQINALVNDWDAYDCSGGVCDCSSLPSAICSNGYCETAYCYNPNPAGCFEAGCPENYGCVDYNQTNDCVSSYCSCDGFYGNWICTDDCNGGSCYQFGDVNYDSNINITDVVSVVNMIIGLSDFSPLSDVNNDDSTNIMDVVALINIILR